MFHNRRKKERGLSIKKDGNRVVNHRDKVTSSGRAFCISYDYNLAVRIIRNVVFLIMSIPELPIGFNDTPRAYFTRFGYYDNAAVRIAGRNRARFRKAARINSTAAVKAPFVSAPQQRRSMKTDVSR